MSGTYKRVGEVAVKAGAKALTEVRAVTAAEAPMVKPASESTKTTMMPWKGWFESFVEDKFGKARLQQWRQLIYYKPDDVHDFNQIPIPNTKLRISKDDPNLTAMFRYPSPGSQDPIRMPEYDDGEDPFDSAYYKRDTGRRGLDPAFKHPELGKIKVALMAPDDPDVEELREKLEAGAESSPGNKGRFATGQSDYDPQGLRSTMSASNEALQESLDANMPDHLPYPTWYAKQDEVIAWYKERDLPIPMGEVGWGTVPREGRIARW